ncbi:MAG: hypothetical protein HC900_11045 [Methylacidiphilales bacterium]|nr:hypothetical protein [Candidatus Methylacidiphilales bacterium]
MKRIVSVPVLRSPRSVSWRFSLDDAVQAAPSNPAIDAPHHPGDGLMRSRADGRMVRDRHCNDKPMTLLIL